MEACPWSGLEPAVLSFCEAQRCAWIVQPANAWSSLAYVFVGLYVLRQAWRHRVLRWFGWTAIAVGISSWFYHSTMTFLGEVLDIGSMYAFSGLILTIDWKRYRGLTEGQWVRFYLPLTLGSLALLIAFKVVGIWIFGIQISVAFLLELVLMRRARARPPSERPRYLNLWLTVALFLASYAIWLLDFHHIWCDPERHWLQGHAVWHLLNSFCFLTLYRYCRQFEKA